MRIGAEVKHTPYTAPKYSPADVNTPLITLKMSCRCLREGRGEAGGRAGPSRADALLCLPFTEREWLLVFAGMELEDVQSRPDGPLLLAFQRVSGKYLEGQRLNLGWSEFPIVGIQLVCKDHRVHWTLSRKRVFFLLIYSVHFFFTLCAHR